MTVGQELRRLLEKLADDKPVVSNSGNDGPEVTIMERGEETHGGNSMKTREPESKEVVRSLVERISEDILKRTTLRRMRVSFKEEVEHLGLDQESEEWAAPERDGEEENLSGESKEWDEGSEKSDDAQDSLCMILTTEKRRYHDRELKTETSSGIYNLEHLDVNEGEEFEMIAVSRKSFRELSYNSNIRTNLEPESDREVMRRIVWVKLEDNIHNPGELKGQNMELKEHVKARYRLSDLIRAQAIDKMTSNLSNWIRTGQKEK